MRFNSITESNLFHKYTKLYHNSRTRIAKFPKRAQYTVGSKIENTILEMIELSFLAKKKKNRSAEILLVERIDVQLGLLKLLLRVANQEKILNDTGYAELSELAIEIGKIIGGWTKNIKTKND